MVVGALCSFLLLFDLVKGVDRLRPLLCSWGKCSSARVSGSANFRHNAGWAIFLLYLLDAMARHKVGVFILLIGSCYQSRVHILVLLFDGRRISSHFDRLVLLICVELMEQA